MSYIKLVNASCADQNVDAVVNAANAYLLAGGGICGVIFNKAGMSKLTEACSAYRTPLNDGDAVITPSFDMKNVKSIIHAVGPDFRSGGRMEDLFGAYYRSMEVLRENGYHSISFPLISSGIFAGNLADPAGESADRCLEAYKKFTKEYPDHLLEVLLCAYGAREYERAKEVFGRAGYPAG